MSEPVDPGMETPLAELPPVDAPEAEPLRVPRKQDQPTGPLRAGLAHARASWRVIVVIVFVQLLFGLTVVVPLWQGLAARLDHHPHAPALAGAQPDPIAAGQGWGAGLAPGIWSDIQRLDKSLFDSLTLTHFWIVVVAWLFGALASGGLIGAAVSREDPVRVGHFFTQGARWYGRMLRVGIVFGLAYYLAARLVIEAWGGAVAPDEFMASSGSSAWWGERLREAVLVFCFLWFRVAADLARAELIVYSKRSALGAFWRGLWRAVRRKVWGTAIVIGVPAFLLLLGLGWLGQALTGDAVLVLVALFIVMQLAVAVRWASRAAVLGAFVKLQ
ncbi:MAG: hypothetical protein QNJ90_11255 [Planctomycetota bacterium]|nr:hypothetical protein [Planctomycetota bacterium]